MLKSANKITSFAKSTVCSTSVFSIIKNAKCQSHNNNTHSCPPLFFQMYTARERSPLLVFILCTRHSTTVSMPRFPTRSARSVHPMSVRSTVVYRLSPFRSLDYGSCSKHSIASFCFVCTNTLGV